MNDGWEDVPAAAPAPASDGWEDVAPTAAPPREVGAGEAFVRGGVQGASMGWSDEAAGLGKALFSGDYKNFGKNYRAARDSEREANRAASDQHGLAYGAGDVAAGVATAFVPGLGAAGAVGKLGRVGSAAVRAGVQGAIGGAGRSEAEDVGGVAADAAFSGAVGGATGGLVSKFLGGAPQRHVDRTLGALTDGAKKKLRDKVGDVADDAFTVANQPAFRAAAKNPAARLELVNDAMAETGAKLDKAYGAAANIPVVKVQRTMDNIAKDLEDNPALRGVARAIRAKMNDVWESWGNKPTVQAQKVREFAGKLADAAFEGSPDVARSQGKEASLRVWGALKDVIDETLEAGGKDIPKEVQALNSRMNTLYRIRNAATDQIRSNAGSPGMRLKDYIGGGIDTALIASNPLLFIAKRAIQHVGIPAAKGVDSRVIAPIVLAAQNGSKPAQLAELGLQLGLSQPVSQAVGMWLAKQYQDVNGAP